MTGHTPDARSVGMRLPTLRGAVVWVLHSGALGDHVLIWPLIRALLRHGARVHLAAHAHHAHLASIAIDPDPALRAALVVHALESPRFNRLWVGECSDKPLAADLVLNFLCDEQTPAGQTWLRGASACIAGAAIRTLGMPGSRSRADLAGALDVAARGAIDPRPSSPDGPIVLFVGAGGQSKRWPIPKWLDLADRLRSSGHDVSLILGPVERELLPPGDLARAQDYGARTLGDLGDLLTLLRSARAYVGADTGPTHLAAQLGLPTLALFGPTDPRIWSPVGPGVRVLAPPSPCSMDWLDVSTVVAAVVAMQ